MQPNMSEKRLEITVMTTHGDWRILKLYPAASSKHQQSLLPVLKQIAVTI